MRDVIYGVGIDPGWKNLGLAVVRKDEDGTITLIGSETINPSSFGNVFKAAQHIKDRAYYIANKDLREKVNPLDSMSLDDFIVQSPTMVFSIERYVSYTGVNTAEMENILMMIGALYALVSDLTTKEIGMYRAIDWKTELVKLLFKKKGFRNPSDKLDKKYSIAAAKACLTTETEIETDHEADAICLGALEFIRAQ